LTSALFFEYLCRSLSANGRSASPLSRIGGAFATFFSLQAGNMAFWRVPLDAQEIQVTQGQVYIIDDRCKGCGYCIEFCPKDILQFAGRFNRKGYHPPVVVKPGECVNCHYCEII
jgi:2-oxoglutarate ferredoxin oxidoreductase subunit delta